MKKLFFYAAAALAMLASCQKTEINESPSKEIDDTKPVAMQFGVNAPSFQVTKTKAAVDAWSETEVFVYGLENTSSTAYEVLIDNYSTTVVDSETPLAIYQDEATQAPYFYTEGKTYDFFGYHLGGATQDPAEPELTDNKVTFGVTFDGSNDVMYAYTDKDEDILKDQTAQVMAKDVYSAWAARRNVQPTLVFDHALTRFNFYVRGMNEKSSKVQIESISAESVLSGNLTVVAKENAGLGFVATANAEAEDVSLKNYDDSDFTPTPVVNGSTYVAGGEGASLILAPDMTQLPIVVKMSNIEYPAITIPNYEFTAKASDVRKTGLAENAGLTKFEKGTAYNIYINVYGPEEIVITAELTKWADGGDYTYDPDAFRPDGTPSTYVNAELTSVADGKIVADITTSDDIAALQARLVAKDGSESTQWQNPPLSTKALGATVTFDNLSTAKIWALEVQYKTDIAAETYTAAEEVQVEAPAESTVLGTSGYVYDKTSFDNYCGGALTWYPESTPQSLPWLAVKLTTTPKHAHIVVTNVNNGKTFKKVFDWAKANNEGISLITISEEELGRELTPGTWNVSVNGASCDIVVPADFEVTASGYVHDEESFNTYCAGKLTWYPESTPQSLPWLAATFTETDKLKVIATCGTYSKSFVFEKENMTLLTLNAEELGTEIMAGDVWYLTLNDVTVKIVVPSTTIKEAVYVNNMADFKTYCGHKLTWDTNTKSTLPWLVVNLNGEVRTANWTVSYNGAKVKSDTWRKADGTGLSLITFNKDELGTEIVAGTWTVDINGMTADIVVE